MKKITVNELKVMLRETGVVTRPSYDHVHSITLSMCLTKELQDYVNKRSKKLRVFKSDYINKLISEYKPVKASVTQVMPVEQVKSVAGFFGKKTGKVFGTRKSIKFDSAFVTKENYNKVKELAAYYRMTRSAVIRHLITEDMNR